ncbi:MAG: hypothetical protein IKY27_08075 [Bacteroidales bacterium]|nr:hypothetical protein [Bacteroidales bacterium]
MSANLSKYDSLTIILVDDVDRLQAKELLDLLKLIRDTADFPYIIYVVAADKVALKSTLESTGIKETELYLRKFFNLEVMFPAFETYRMLRDHSSYIFDNAGHMLTLNEDAKKGIINKIENRRIQNMISKITEKDNYEEHVQTSEQNFPTNLRDTIELCRPATEDIVSSLISNIFSDTYRESYNSISFTSEYFKYFAGCYRKTQISDKEIAEILLSTDTDFRVNYRDILKDRNDSFTSGSHTRETMPTIESAI